MKEVEIFEKNDNIDRIIEYYCDKNVQFLLQQFLNQVNSFFELNPRLHIHPFPVIHSLKSRLKDPEHLRDKLRRKTKEGLTVTRESLFQQITDLAGVRVLHLHQEQFKIINEEIMKKISNEDWVMGETPKAFTWDPETRDFFKELDIETEIRDTYYTSVHYLVKSNSKDDIFCEIQVRTLFEEIWGEIDHIINYPHTTESVACKEQLRVLSKLVSTGTRLSDSIFRSYKEHIEKGNKDI